MISVCLPIVLCIGGSAFKTSTMYTLRGVVIKLVANPILKYEHGMAKFSFLIISHGSYFLLLIDDILNI